MLNFKKICGQLLMALCLAFITNAPAYAQSSCDGATGSCINNCGDGCNAPSYGSGDCLTGVICCYNPDKPGEGSYWSNTGCQTPLNPNAYAAADCGSCTCCYNPNNHEDYCATWN